MHHPPLRCRKGQHNRSRKSALCKTFATLSRLHGRASIPKVPHTRRVGVRVYFQLHTGSSIQLSLTPKRSLYQGRLQSCRIRQQFKSWTAFRQNHNDMGKL